MSQGEEHRLGVGDCSAQLGLLLEADEQDMNTEGRRLGGRGY